jgi:CHASE2 domain
MPWRRLRVCIGIFLLLLAVEVIVSVTERMPQMQPALRFASDGSMRLLAQLAGGRETGLRLGFIEMDDDSERKYLLGGVTDRAPLIEIIKKASGQIPAPMALIIDIDLSLPGEHNKDLRDYLVGYKGPAPLVIVRTLRPYKKNGTIQTIRPTGSGHTMEVVQTIPDDSAEAHGGLSIDGLAIGGDWVRLASAGFLSDSDGRVQRAIIAEPVCVCENNNKLIHGIPSVELLALAIDARHTEDVERDVRQAFNGPCDHGQIDPTHSSVVLTPEQGRPTRIDLADRNIGLIAYTLFPSGTGARDDRLNTVSAFSFLNECPQGAKPPEKSPCNMTDRIVVIGGTPEGDTHPTALGKMPGGLLLLNAIESLYQNGQVTKAPPGLVVLIGFAFGLIIWFLSSWLLRTNLGMLLSLTFVVVGTFYLNRLFLRNGLWFDLGPPILGFIAHPMIESLLNLYTDIVSKGWRALLNKERE